MNSLIIQMYTYNQDYTLQEKISINSELLENRMTSICHSILSLKLVFH